MSDITPQHILPDLLNDFSQFVPQDARSKVINYQGLEGLKQVTLNSTKAQGELRIFEIENMGSFLNFGFCEDVRKQFVKNQIQVKELTNQPTQSAWTGVTEFVEKFWDCRYVDPQTLKTHLEMLVYNDVTTLYNYKNNQIFCVEIYNQNLADMQKQVFDFIWQHSQQVTIGAGGATKLVEK